MQSGFIGSILKAVRVFLLLLLLVHGVNDAPACMQEVCVSKMTQGADVILEGRVTGLRSFWNADKTSILTEVTLQVEDVLKGAIDKDSIVVMVRGGQVGSLRQESCIAPRFVDGEQSILFLKALDKQGQQALKMTASDVSVGRYTVYQNIKGKIDVTESKVGDLDATEFKQRLNEISPNSETDSVAELSGAIEASRIDSLYVIDARWQSAEPTVGFRISTGFTSAQNQAIRNAMSPWNGAGTPFRFSYLGTHSRAGYELFNGVNEVVWDNIGALDSTLAYANYWRESIGGGPFYIVETDIVFNSAKSWSTIGSPTAYDLESVALHELGHCIALGHTAIQDAVMYAFIGAGDIKRTLRSDDVAGIRAIYGLATPPGAPSLSSPANGATVSGTSVTFSWTQPSGSPTRYHFQLSRFSSFSSIAYEDDMLTLAYESLVNFPNDGTVYYWRVRAQNSVGWGAWSVTRHFTNGSSPTAADAVYRFWSPVFSGHFFTISSAERDHIMATWPDVWQHEGVAWRAHAAPSAGTSPVYRFWSPVFSRHFFTISLTERNHIMATWPDIWHYEGVAWHAYPLSGSGRSPIYRFWSPVFSGHFYTMSAVERDNIMATWPDIWTYEGIAYYAYAPDAGSAGSSMAYDETNAALTAETKDAGDLAGLLLDTWQADAVVSEAGGAAKVGPSVADTVVELDSDGVYFPLQYADTYVAASVYDPGLAAWKHVLAPSWEPDGVAVAVSMTNRNWLAVLTYDAAAERWELGHGSWFGRLLEPEAGDPELVILEDAPSDIGLPVETLLLPAEPGELLLLVYDVAAEAYIETIPGLKGGARYDWTVPQWNRWYRLDIVREQDGEVLQSQWVGHMRTH